MPVPHETAKNYEVGLKASLFDRRVYFDLTLFHTDFYGYGHPISAGAQSALAGVTAVSHRRRRAVTAVGHRRRGPSPR